MMSMRRMNQMNSLRLKTDRDVLEVAQLDLESDRHRVANRSRRFRWG